MPKADAIRLGEIAFINALPLALGHMQSLLDVPLERVRLSPKQLNQRMIAGELDISPVSSVSFLRHQDKWDMLDDLSISASQPVESVLLVQPMEQRNDARIWVPDTSETSVALAQAILFAKTGKRYTLDECQVYPPGQALNLLKAGYTVLTIGDEALELTTIVPPQWVTMTDLAQAWIELTQTPFVFAVWAVQKSWAETHVDELIQVSTMLTNQKKRFQADPMTTQRVFKQAFAQAKNLSMPQIDHYLTQAICYDFTPLHQQSLTLFGAVLEWLDDESNHHQPPNWLSASISV